MTIPEQNHVLAAVYKGLTLFRLVEILIPCASHLSQHRMRNGVAFLRSVQSVDRYKHEDDSWEVTQATSRKLCPWRTTVQGERGLILAGHNAFLNFLVETYIGLRM
jgi:hypothetical protein